MTIPEAVRALTVGDCPARREAVRVIRKYFEGGDPLDKIRAEIVHLHDWAFDRDGVLKIVDKYRESQERSGGGRNDRM